MPLLRKPLEPYAIDRIVAAAEAVYVQSQLKPKEFCRDRIIAILYRHLEVKDTPLPRGHRQIKN